MKTNQLMEVRLGKYGLIHAKHLTAMLNLNDILVVGNDVRKSKGLGEKKLKTFLERKDTWEYVLKVFHSEVEDEYNVLNREKGSKSFSPIGLKLFKHLKDFPTTKSDGKIQYSEIFKTKQFDAIYKRQTRGKFENRGLWANLYLAIDFAMWLDVDVKHEVIKTFVEGKLLQLRDQGGDAFKKLNILIDTLPDRIAKAKKRNISIVQNNKMVYRNIATMINKKINGAFDEGWNDEKKEAFEQERRAEILKQLCFSINMGFVQSYDSLKETIGKL